MANERELEVYFDELGYSYELLGPRMWVLDLSPSGSDGKVVVSFSPPLVVLRMKVAELPAGDNAALFRTLLEANAQELVHGAFGVEGNAIVVVDTLEAEYLDVAELQASLDGVAFAAATIIPRLKGFSVK